MRREAQPGAILAAARRAADLLLLIQRRRQLPDVEAARLERQHRGAARRLGARPDLHAVYLLQPLDERRRQLARALLDDRASDPGLERQRFAERDHRRLVALPETLEGPRHADAARIRAEDA